MNQQILSIRTYQAVSFENKLHTFFTSEETANKKGVNIELVKEYPLVLVSTEKDSVLIPYANISGIYLKTDYKMEKITKHKEDISKEPKSQKIPRSKSDPKL